MAKEQSGYMAANLGGPSEPSAANPATAAQAAEIRGRSKAADIAFLGGMAVDAATGYQAASMEKELRDVAERTFNPDTGYRGAKADAAFRAAGDQAVLDARESELFNNTNVQGQFSEGAIAELNTIREELSRVQTARQQEVLSPTQARTEMHAIVRKYSAQLPGLAPEIRKQAAAYTGIDDPGLDTMAGLLRMQKTSGKSLAEEVEERTVKDLVDKGYGAMFGVNDPQQVLAHVKARDSVGKAMLDKWSTDNMATTAKTRNTTILENNKVLSETNAVEYERNLMAGVVASYNNAFISQDARLRSVGIDLKNIDATRLGDRESTAIMTAMRDVYGAARNQLFGAMQEVNNGIATQKIMPQHGQQILNNLRKQADDIEKSMNAPLDSVLNDIKSLKTGENLSLDNLLKTVQIRSQILTSAFGSKLVADMQDDRKADSLLAQYPNNQALISLREMIVSLRRDGIANAQAAARFTNYQNIAEGMANPDATNAQKGAAVDASPADREAAAGLVKLDAIPALKQSFTPSQEQARAIVQFAGDMWAPGGEEYNVLKSALQSGRLKEATTIINPDPKAYEGVLNRVGQRSEALLQHNTWKTSNILKQGDMKLSYSNGTISVVQPGPKVPGMSYAQGQAAYDVGRKISEWNNILDMYAIAGGDREKRAKQLVADVNAQVAKPAASFTPTFNTRNQPTGKPFSVTADELKGLSLTEMEEKLQQTGMPDQFVRAIMKDVTGVR